MNHVTSIGLDVHARSITAVALDSMTGEVRSQRFGYSPTELASWILGFQLENIVFMELLRRGYEVHIGTFEQNEIDFVAKKHADYLYIQVCETLLDEATKTRETAPLDAIGDSYEKMILTRDDTAIGTTRSDIRIRSLIDWLLETQ